MSSSDSEESDIEILEDTAEVGVGSVWATLKSLGALALSTWAIVYLFAFGWVLIQTRTLFLWLCPTMIELAVPLVFVINAIQDVFVLFVDAAEITFNAVADIINAIPGAGHVDSITLPIGFPPPQLTVAEFRDTLQEIMRRCPPFNSMERILQYLSNLAIGRHACVAIRYLYPLPGLFNALQAILFWTYRGGAEPIPDDPTQNCAEATAANDQDLICVGFGIGFFIVDLLLPLLLLALVLPKYFGVIKDTFKLLYQLVRKGATKIDKTAGTVFNPLFDKTVSQPAPIMRKKPTQRVSRFVKSLFSTKKED